MNTWTATDTSSAPTARERHTALWTNSEMMVWGGSASGTDVNTGGRYNPTTDSWTGTTATNAPAARKDHTAVWANSEMIVWGGLGTGNLLDTGGRYCAQSGAPTPTPTPRVTPRPRPTPRARPTQDRMITYLTYLRRPSRHARKAEQGF